MLVALNFLQIVAGAITVYYSLANPLPLPYLIAIPLSGGMLMGVSVSQLWALSK